MLWEKSAKALALLSLPAPLWKPGMTVGNSCLVPAQGAGLCTVTQVVKMVGSVF